MKAKGIDKRIIEISEKLKYLRKKRGWTSYETFALDNNVDRKQYWRIENGTNFTISSLLKILDIHKITLKEFFNIEIEDRSNKNS